MIYHILNGDALLGKFPEEIPGERISFRECLIDGPVKAENLKEFWAIREKFIASSYPNPANFSYQSYSQAELERILHIPIDSKVYCWFEEDLFCQVNLWFVLNLLQGKKVEVFLALPYPDSPYNFTVLSDKELVDSYLHKAHFLSEKEREILAKLWIHYQNQDVFEALKIADLFLERFPFLKPAVEAWRDMIPLGDFQGKPIETLKEIQRETATYDFGKVFQEFQKRLPNYGFGDTQVQRMWETIKKEG
ncbi:hypothetical protein DFQ04_1322 [Algoriphagus boseongensis]|uniref:DUF1835 domain-containing protein n=1 Tax=Algoriphagus boseongensis TaxID=1442587 RepID=A0A4R6T8W9_9BACT|nr:DUF1835 domain-containing protein [Algoriphagus boseongensis]TDQ19500.1 hypothetical protein DFQ04_1322 [Algoriphagus boseongensis]